MIERRPGKFVETLSCLLIIFSSVGALLVLIDPVISFQTAGGTTITLGGDGFAEQMKGAVVMLVLVGGFTAVINFWIGASDQGSKAQESVNVIAKASAPVTAAAVAAATGQPAVPLAQPEGEVK